MYGYSTKQARVGESRDGVASVVREREPKVYGYCDVTSYNYIFLNYFCKLSDIASVIKNFTNIRSFSLQGIHNRNNSMHYII